MPLSSTVSNLPHHNFSYLNAWVTYDLILLDSNTNSRKSQKFGLPNMILVSRFGAFLW